MGQHEWKRTLDMLWNKAKLGRWTIEETETLNDAIAAGIPGALALDGQTKDLQAKAENRGGRSRW